MAIKSVGAGQWFSTLTNQIYDSEKAAAKYDNIEQRKAAASERGHEILEKLSTEDMKSLILAMNGEVDQANGRAAGVATANAWFAAHPEFVSSASPEGTSNGAKMAGWLEAHGKRRPFTEYDLDAAYAALSAAGELYIDGSKLPKAKPVDPADQYTDLDSWQLSSSRYMGGR